MPTIIVRETARLQAVFDNYRFLKARTQQLIQVGNGLPPLLPQHIADVLHNLLSAVGGNAGEVIMVGHRDSVATDVQPDEDIGARVRAANPVSA